MKRALLGLLMVWSVCAFGVADTVSLKAKKVYGKEAKIISNLLDRYHYRRIGFTDSLSSVVLDAYVQSLDPSRSYFLEGDIKSFEPYRFKIDDFVNAERVDVAYTIFKVFKSRYVEQMDYVMKTLVNQEFDYTTNEFYDSDRENAPWPKTKAEANDIWRKTVKSQALSLKLSGKKQEEISKTLTTRFERFQKSLTQFNSEDVFSIFMNAITEAYDPHTNYLSPKASDLFKQAMSLSLEGIGARLQTENDYTKIFEIIPGGPADKSGKLHVGDFIIGVAQGEDGELVDIIGWRVDDAVKLIKGPKGTTVRLQILPGASGQKGAPEVISLVRDKIKLEDQAAKKEMLHMNNNGRDVKMGVITLPNFYMDFDAAQRGETDYRSTTRDVRKLIGELQKEGMEGLVIDLRNNGGGSLDEAIDLTGLFIKNGPVVQVRDSENEVQIREDEDLGVVYNGPLVVLTNRFSASASEIFAGAIQDYGRGIIVGENTFGKGTVQSVIDLKRILPNAGGDPLGSLKITFQKFYRVSGSSTQHKGVSPDVILPSPFDADKFGESASETALPWDVIKKAAYQKTGYVNDQTLKQVRQAFEKRAATDPQYRKYVENVGELRDNYNQTRISLNETVRRKEMAEAEEKKTQAAKLNTKIKGTETSTDELSTLEDEFLREGLLILSDLVLKRVG